MARKENMSNTEGVSGDLGVFTLNETSVGKRGNNKKRSDVQLIQFFLRQFYKAHPELFILLPKTKSNSNLIIIDGDCGGQTKAGILHFQKDRSIDAKIKVDSLVDVAHSLISSISKTTYTIHHLNHWFQLHAEGKEHHGNLENHPDVIAYAPELHAELAVAGVGDEF